MKHSTHSNKKEIIETHGDELLTKENKAALLNKKELFENKWHLVESFVNKVIIERNLELLPEFVHEDVEINSASGFRGKGLEIHRKALLSWHEAFDVVSNESLERFVDGDSVVSHWRVTALHKGLFSGVEPTNKEVTFTGVNFYKILDNKISSIRGYTDFNRSDLTL